ncbi:alpha/beta hydrolase [Erythrobacter sp. HA6-11]
MSSNLIHETRSHKLSLVMRLVKWVVSKRSAIFPQEAEAVEAFLNTRNPPSEAPLPDSVAAKCVVENWELEGQPCVTLHPRDAKGTQHILYFHGGGFVLPIVKEHWVMLGHMVERLNVRITVALYDLVPEHSYINAEQLADAAYDKLTQDWAPSDMVLAGDSAGAHMALSLALRLGARGKPQAGRLLLFAPWLDVSMADPAMQAIEPHDIMLKIGALRKMGEIWSGDRELTSPQCSPLYASEAELAALPPTAIFVGTHDLFVIDSRTFATKLANAGVQTRLYEYVGAPHVYMIAVPSREAKDTFALVEDFLR